MKPPWIEIWNWQVFITHGTVMSLLVFVFALKGVLYPSKGITLTHKHGDVKTPARRFFYQKNFDARGKDKTPWSQQRNKAKLSAACRNV